MDEFKWDLLALLAKHGAKLKVVCEGPNEFCWIEIETKEHPSGFELPNEIDEHTKLIQ